MTILDSNTIPSSGATKATTSISNKYTVGATSSNTQITAGITTISALSGALTANTLKSMVNITGTSGSIPQCALITNDTTSRTVRLKITVDGAYDYDVTSSAIVSTGYGVVAAGSISFGVAFLLNDGEPIKFKTSCQIWIASSLTETDKITLLYNRHSEA